jgi:hypothetical protein
MEIIIANKFYSKNKYKLNTFESDLFNFTLNTIKTTIFVKINFLFQ